MGIKIVFSLLLLLPHLVFGESPDFKGEMRNEKKPQLLNKKGGDGSAALSPAKWIELLNGKNKRMVKKVLGNPDQVLLRADFDYFIYRSRHAGQGEVVIVFRRGRVTNMVLMNEAVLMNRIALMEGNTARPSKFR